MYTMNSRPRKKEVDQETTQVRGTKESVPRKGRIGKEECGCKNSEEASSRQKRSIGGR